MQLYPIIASESMEVGPKAVTDYMPIASCICITDGQDKTLTAAVVPTYKHKLESKLSVNFSHRIQCQVNQRIRWTKSSYVNSIHHHPVIWCNIVHCLKASLIKPVRIVNTVINFYVC